MLTRILDTTEIDMNNPEIRVELNTDLRRMDHLRHEEMPEGSGVYRVKVMPSTRTYLPGLHRFRFEIQYGNMLDGELKPKGEKVLYQTETLPMI
ncbi:MAG: hypothetical protein AABW75_00960 [Nanoarchaeota archaeon]